MIKVITGSMFSGKSYELIKTIKGKDIKTVKIFKPSLDTRDEGIIKSRKSKKVYRALLIDSLEEIPQYIDENTKTIVIDEAQFLKGNVSIIVDLHLKGYDFIIAGLNLTSERKPFGLMRNIMCIATEVKILKAKCLFCHKERAEYTCYALEVKKEDIFIGNGYIPVCRECLNDILNTK